MEARFPATAAHAMGTATGTEITGTGAGFTMGAGSGMTAGCWGAGAGFGRSNASAAQGLRAITGHWFAMASATVAKTLGQLRIP